MDHLFEVRKEAASQQKKAQEAQPKPHPVGLPAKPKQKKGPKSIEHKRVATPPPAQIGSNIARDAEPVPIVDSADGLTTPTKLEVEETEVISLESSLDEVEEKLVIIFSTLHVTRVDQELITTSCKPEHVQFWADMALTEFVALSWRCDMGTYAEYQQFVMNSDKESTKVQGVKIDLREAALAVIFKLGLGSVRDPGLRAKTWQLQKFTIPKEKNGYKLNTCIDKGLVECSEFIWATLYLQDRRNMISGAQVREAEEVLGGGTN
ncbi:unnamed protein product [Calypogeia fissa]